MTQLLRRTITSMARGPAAAAAIAMLEKLGDSQSDLLRVLLYHRVDEPLNRLDLYSGTLSATPEDFCSQIRHVATNYNAISMADVLTAFRHRRPLPPRSVLVTFDDAYRDFAKNAWPILSSYGVPATLFVPTSFPDSQSRFFWWDRLCQIVNSAKRPHIETPLGDLALTTSADRMRALRKLVGYVKSLHHDEVIKLVKKLGAETGTGPAHNEVLSWQELRELYDQGVTLAPHTRNHPLLPRIGIDEARREIVGSLEDLRSRFPDVPPVLAYPSGCFNDEVTSLLEAEGIELAFTSCRGVNSVRTSDPFRLRRINVGLNTTSNILRAQLLPTARFVYSLWPCQSTEQ